MKKYLSALILLLIFSLALPAHSESLDCTGVWSLNSYEMDGMRLDASVFGMEMTLTINPDGSLSLEIPGSGTSTGRWEISGSTLKILAGEESIEATINGDELVTAADENGTSMIFGRERKNTAFQPAPARTDVTVSDFDGTWQATSMGILGNLYPAESDITLQISNGLVSVQQPDDEGNLLEYDAKASLEKGVLIVSPPEDLEGARELCLQLLEDGSLAHSEESEGMIIEIYFTRCDN